MTHIGGHRVRSLARWIATPTLLVSGGLVAYANVSGSVALLRIASVVALAAAVGAVVLFDTDLVRTRRTHGRDRAALARSYAATYAAHIRVTDPRSSTPEWVPVSDQPPQAWPVASRPPTVTVSGANPAGSSAADTRPTPPAITSGAQATSDRPADGDLWPGIEDAPTVVDMVAWGERAVDRTPSSDLAPGGPAASGVTDVSGNATTGTGEASGRSGPATGPEGIDTPTDDPRNHAHGPDGSERTDHARPA